MAQVKFKKFGSNTAFGSFSPGDRLRTSDAFAAHLVESGVADYADAPEERQPPNVPAAPTTRKTRVKK